jgi:hypothetical protein
MLALSLALLAFANTAELGKSLSLPRPVPIGAILVDPAAFVGKTVQVEGKITEVCQMAGCWMALVDPASAAVIRVKVNDGEIVFPKDSIGRTAIAEGKLMKLELTREQAVARARHEAEEQGRQFDPKSVRGTAVIYQIQGTGAVITIPQSKRR